MFRLVFALYGRNFILISFRWMKLQSLGAFTDGTCATLPFSVKRIHTFIRYYVSFSRQFLFLHWEKWCKKALRSSVNVKLWNAGMIILCRSKYILPRNFYLSVIEMHIKLLNIANTFRKWFSKCLSKYENSRPKRVCRRWCIYTLVTDH